MTTRNQWDSSADWYDQNMGNDGDQLNAAIIKPALFDVLGDISDSTILDVGCGSGYVTAQLAQAAKQVLGTDFSPEFIKLCQQKYSDYENLRFAQQDLTQPFDLSGQTFDVVISKMVLQYVPEIQTFAKESVQALSKNGRLIVIVDHPFHTQFFYAQALAGKTNPKYRQLENYFSHAPQTKLSLWGKVELTWYPRTVSEYVQTFVDVGLRLKTMKELEETKDEVVLPRVLVLEFDMRS